MNAVKHKILILSGKGGMDKKKYSVWLEVVMKVVRFVLMYQFGFVLKIIINKTSNNQRLQSAGDNRLRAVSLFLQI